MLFYFVSLCSILFYPFLFCATLFSSVLLYSILLSCSVFYCILFYFQVIPALQSFCVYAAVGIVATFIFQSTLFVACLSLDEKRVSQSRNALLCCYVHKDYEPTECSQYSPLQAFFGKIYGPLVVKLPFKVFTDVFKKKQAH